MNITALALWLHSGTFLAALVYFWEDVKKLIKALFYFRQAEEDVRKILVFLIIATTISWLLGFILVYFTSNFEASSGVTIGVTTKIITLAIGLMLLITAWLQFRAKREGQKNAHDLRPKDGVTLGLVQALAALPGLSRSGLTMSALLFKKFSDTAAIKLSFLMSLPIVLGGNIVLNSDKFTLSSASLAGLTASFIFGLITIGGLLKIAKRINFSWFVFGFGLLTIIAGILQ